MQDITHQIRLIAEHYDMHPQPIVWMQPVFDKDGATLTDFRFTYSNEEGLKYLELPVEDFNGLLLSKSPTLTEPFRTAVMQEMTMVYQTGKLSDNIVYNPALHKYARVLRTRLHDGVLTIIQDITEERRIISQLEKQTLQLEKQTQQLQQQQVLMDNILKNSSNGISVSQVFRDENGVVVDALTIMANDAAVKYIGLPKDIYLSKRATEIEPAVMHSPYYQACIRTLDTGEPFVMQYQMQATGRWLELTVSKLDYYHLIQIFSDVTPIKEAQLQLEKAAKTLKTVFDVAQTGMFTFHPQFNEQNELIDFRFAMTNEMISEYLGKRPDELAGEPGSMWFPGYHTEGVFQICKHSFESGEPQQKELHFSVKGHDRYLDLQCVKVNDQLLITVTDHTSLRKSQLQLQEMVQTLERSNSYLEDFAHAASHDLKEPIRKVLNFASRLKPMAAGGFTEGSTELVEKIESAGKRMQLLIDDLLEFSYLREQAPEEEPVDLGEKIKKVLYDLELAIEEKQAQVVITDPLPRVPGNKRQLQQLFQNLIANALKYSRRDVTPVIKVSCRVTKKEEDELTRKIPLISEKEFYLITISDNGIGFDQQYAEKIFEMFVRLHNRAEFAGTGIGLALARKVVENHHGYIWAESAPGKGASFKILLPVANP